MVASSRSGNTLLTSPPSLRKIKFIQIPFKVPLTSGIPFEIVDANLQLIHIQWHQLKIAQCGQCLLVFLVMVFVKEFDQIAQRVECGTDFGVAMHVGAGKAFREFQCLQMETFAQRSLLVRLMDHL